MLYGSKYYAVGGRIEQNMSVAKMRMIRWMSEVTIRARLRYEIENGRVGVLWIVNKIIKNIQR